MHKKQISIVLRTKNIINSRTIIKMSLPSKLSFCITKFNSKNKNVITKIAIIIIFLLLICINGNNNSNFFFSSGNSNIVEARSPFDGMFVNCCYYVTIRNCTGQNEVSHRCADCSKPTPYCGEGRCNVFGCNCAACRTQKLYTKIVGTATWITEHF